MIDTENGPRALTYAEYKALKKRREVTHTIVTDDDAVTAYRLAKERRDSLGFADAETRALAQKAVDEAEAAVRASAIVFRLRALPREGEGSYAVLKAEHPPTAADDAELQEATGNPKAKAVWHTETFGPAVVAACLVAPAMTVEQAAAEKREMNDAEWRGLYYAAIDVNQQATDTAGLVFS